MNFEFTEIETGLIAKTISSEGDFLMATVEDIMGTKKYKVYMNGNTPVYELYEEIDYGKEFIVIKPLNTK